MKQPETKRQRRREAYKKQQQEIEAEAQQLARSAVTCLRCGQEGHLAENCPTLERNRRKATKEDKRARHVKCFHCGKMGHFSKDCPNASQAPRRGGRPATLRKGGKNSKQQHRPKNGKRFAKRPPRAAGKKSNKKA